MWDCGSGEVWARRGKEVFLWGCGGREGWGRMVESKESWVKIDHRECRLAPFSLLDLGGRAALLAGRASEPEGRASGPQSKLEEPLRKVQRWESLRSS